MTLDPQPPALGRRIEEPVVEHYLGLGGGAKGIGSSQGLEQTTEASPNYHNSTNTNTVTRPTITVSQFYNAVLLPSPGLRGDLCANADILHTPASKLKDDVLREVQSAPAWDYTPQLDFLHRLFYACKASRIQHCDCHNCASLKERLRKLIPGPTRWGGFEDWALQLAACVCAQKTKVHGHIENSQLCALPAVVISAVNDCDLKPILQYPAREYVYATGGTNNPFQDWAEKVVLSDVLGILSWLNGISTGYYEVVREPLDLSKTVLRSVEEHEHGGLFTDLIMEAIERAKSFQLCPHRTWAIAEGLPGKEFNLPALVPPIGKIPVSAHAGHDHCTADFCEESSVNFTSVAQLHECQHLPRSSGQKPGNLRTLLQGSFGKLPFWAGSKQGHYCKRTKGKFRQKLLNEPALAGTPTAWKLDGHSIIEPTQPYMAISHVWADGTGVGAWPVGEVNECLYSFFRRIAEQFHCEGIWWDTISIPQDKKLRTQAINNMHDNYANARITLVHDLYLRSCEWVDAESACFAIVMSSWFTRGWTALELAKSPVVKVIFKSDSNGPVIKDLDEDILAKAGEPSSSWRQVATTSILNLRSNRRGITDINGILTSLGPRYTSKPRDMSVISGLLAGIEVPREISQQEIYQRVLMKLGKISDGNLFHNSATMSKGFSWCPTSLLDIPLAAADFSTSLVIQDNGDIVGYWGVVGPSDGMSTEYIWKDVHPLTKAATQFALRQSDKHLCLVERKAPFISRALLVKVMRRPNEETPTEVHCKFIGSVYFRSLGGNIKAGEIEVRIGDTEGMVELEGETALDYAQRVWEERKKRDPNATGGIRKLMKSVGIGGISYVDAPDFWDGSSAVFGKEQASNAYTCVPEGWDTAPTRGPVPGFSGGWGSDAEVSDWGYEADVVCIG